MGIAVVSYTLKDIRDEEVGSGNSQSAGRYPYRTPHPYHTHPQIHQNTSQN
jgi:hypothetical protein